MSKKYYLQVLVETDDTYTWGTMVEVNAAQATLLQDILYKHAVFYMKRLKDAFEDIVDDFDSIKELQEGICEEDDDDDNTVIIPNYDIQEIDISRVGLEDIRSLPVIPFITFLAKVSTEELQENISNALETVSGILERNDFIELVETTWYRVIKVQDDNNLNRSHISHDTKHLKSEQPKKIYPFW